jgi:16S rRNA (adenine1518-N6/adenine1519-N6)-dimethyltransferase
VSDPPRQLTLARLAELGIRPDRDLGQHFLLDDNVLRVAERLARLEPDDSVLEVGAGVGLLTAFLAERVAHVHAVEIDRRLEEALARSLEGRRNVTVLWGDAMRLRLGELAPPVTACVSNFPYHIAAPFLLDSIGGLPTCTRWCGLVQREIADRLTARPGDPLYGAPSVLSALALEPMGRHPVSRHVFVPPPNVDSALVAFRRREDWSELAPRWEDVRATVAAAFSHRRKTIANSLALGGWAPRDEVERRLRAAGIDPRARAEALAPEDLRRLAETA